MAGTEAQQQGAHDRRCRYGTFADSRRGTGGDPSVENSINQQKNFRFYFRQKRRTAAG
jgi:hypothetical protein